MQVKLPPPMFAVANHRKTPHEMFVVSRRFPALLHVAGEPLARCISVVLNAGGTGTALGPISSARGAAGLPPIGAGHGAGPVR